MGDISDLKVIYDKLDKIKDMVSGEDSVGDAIMDVMDEIYWKLPEEEK
jgi:hypothetical protein